MAVDRAARPGSLRSRQGRLFRPWRVVAFLEVIINNRFATSVRYTISVNSVLRVPSMVETLMTADITLGDIRDINGQTYVLLDVASIGAPGVLRYRYSTGVYLRSAVLLDDVDNLIENLRIQWRAQLLSVTTLRVVYGLQEEVIMSSGYAVTHLYVKAPRVAVAFAFSRKMFRERK